MWSPEWKIGRTSRMSGRCEVLPSIMYGSLRAMTSPSLRSSSLYGEFSRTVSTGLPNWPTIMRPFLSAIRGNSSACSLITGLTAVVTRTRSISWRMFLSAFSMMSSVTWSMSCSRTKSGSAPSRSTISLALLDQDVPEAVHGPPVARLDHGRRVVLHHHGRSRDLVAGPQPVPVQDGRLHPSAEISLLRAHHRAGDVGPRPVLTFGERDALDGAAPDNPHGRYLQRRVGQIEAVALAVGLLEPLAQERRVLPRRFVELEAAGDLDVLQVVAAICVQVEPPPVVLDPLAGEPLVGLGDEALNGAFQLGGRRLFGGAQIRLGELVLDVRREEAEGAHDPGRRGHYHRARADEPAERAGVHRAGPAEGNEPEPARVVAPLHADHAERGVHVLVDDLEYRLRRLLHAHTERLRHGLHGPSRRLFVELQRAAEGDAWRDAVQDHVRVRHRRGLAAPAVGRGPRVGAGARRAHLQGAARREEGDGAPASADAVDVG